MSDKKTELFYSERGKLAYESMIGNVDNIHKIFEPLLEKEKDITQLVQLKLYALKEAGEEKRKIITAATEIDRQERVAQTHIVAMVAMMNKAKE